ncbi:MAG: MFS transporter [Candidatus Methanogranum gryphiswaldense]|nr:MAG: MFS transporter [Candidatus Methanogranum sp. U3.2.1]
MENSVYSKRESKMVLLATCVGSILTPLMGTMMSLALPCIGRDFGVGAHSLAMINTSFLIASVMFMVPAARFASIYGMRKMSMIGLVVVTISAILSAMSPNLEFLLIMRFILGAGSSVLAVTGVAMLSAVYPLEKRGWAIGVYMAVMLVGFTVGPSLGGAISDVMGWRVLFVLVVPISVLSFVFFMRFKKEIAPMRGENMDTKGAILWMASILMLMYGVAYITESWALILIFLGAISLAFTFYLLKGMEQPVLKVELFRISMFRRSCLAAFMNYAAASSLTFFMALYLQSIGEMTATEAGILMMLQPLVQVFFTIWAGSLSDRMRDKRILPTLGMGIVCIGSAMMIFIELDTSLAYMALILLVFGAGMALFSAPNVSAIVSSVPKKYQGEAAGMASVFRQIGMMISMGIAMICISIFMGYMGDITPSNYGDFIDSIHLTFMICLALCIIGAVISWFRGKPIKDQ